MDVLDTTAPVKPVDTATERAAGSSTPNCSARRVKPRVRKSPIYRAVFNTRNSACPSALLVDLSTRCWWTDDSDPTSLYIHAYDGFSQTWHRVRPRAIRGYRCNRMAMEGDALFWVYDRMKASNGGTK